MNASYKIMPGPSERTVTIALNGKLSEASLPALDESIAAARTADREIMMDLSEVTLLDRKAVQYLTDKSSRDIKIVNCPAYLRHWLTQVNDES